MFPRISITGVRKIILAGWIMLSVVGCDDTRIPESLAYPQRPVRVIVPFTAGGGSDMFARVIADAVETHQLLPERLVIINHPGASGTIGSRRLLNSEPDGYTLLCLHEAILTAKYSGKVTYGPEAFEPIAGTGTSPLVICVVDGSRFDSLKGLMESAAESPDTIVYSASIGAPSQFAGLMLEQVTPGAKFRYTQTGGGAKRFAALDGGHVDVSAFSLAEYSQFRSAGLRALAVCRRERHPDFPEIPTALEQGFDCVSENMQFWWAPRNTPPERVQVLADVFRQALELPEVRQRLAEMRIDPVYLEGDRLVAELQQREDRLKSVSKPAPIVLPNLPLTIAFATFALGALVLTQRWRLRQQALVRRVAEVDSTTLPYAPAGQTDETVLEKEAKALASGSGSQGVDEQGSEASAFGSLRSTPGLSRPTSEVTVSFVGAIAATVLYVGSMQAGWLSFRVATIGFLISLSTLLLWTQTRQAPSKSLVPFLSRVGVFAVFAVALSFVVEAVFTQFLVIDLP